jgi:hypothetical protein
MSDDTSKAILQTEFSEEFVEWMKRAMTLSFYKYGKLKDAYPNKIDAIASLKKRLEKYERDGNSEWLIDVANFAMIEFMHPRHEKAHFAAQSSEQSIGRVDAADGRLRHYDNNGADLKRGYSEKSRLAQFR